MIQPARAPSIEQYRQAFETLRPALPGAAAREAAFARFAELGFPGPRDEAWKYTSLRRLEGRRFAPAAAAAAQSTTVALPAALGDRRIVLVNGHLRTDLSELERMPPGVRLHTGGAARTDDGVAAAVLRWPVGGGTERFAALNAALSADPLLVDVDAGTRCGETLHFVLVADAPEPTMSFPRVTFRLGAGSALRVVLHHVGDEAGEHFIDAVVDAELADGAELHACRLQEAGSRAFLIERFEARVGAAARLAVRDSQLGGSLGRLDLHVALTGRGAETELTGLFLADAARHLDTHVHVAHRALETRSVQDYRGVAANRGRAVFNGRTVVHEGAQKSNARQSSRNLLLTPGAEIDTKPELEIYADDVQCGHGATTGQLDPAAMFYLRSRGLSESEARSALTRAFAGAVLSRIDSPGVAARVHDELDRRLVRLLESRS